MYVRMYVCMYVCMYSNTDIIILCLVYFQTLSRMVSTLHVLHADFDVLLIFQVSYCPEGHPSSVDDGEGVDL